MKTAVGLSNFFKGNTPKLMQLIGDISMLAGFVAGLPIAINLISQEAGMTIVIPAFVLKASKISTLVLLGIKYFTKFLGTKDEVKTAEVK